MEGLPTRNCNFEVTPELIIGAMIGADALGEAYLADEVDNK